MMKFWFCTSAIVALGSLSVASAGSIEATIQLFLDVATRLFTDSVDNPTVDHSQNWDNKNMYLSTRTNYNYKYHWAIPFGDVEQGVFQKINGGSKDASVRTLINTAKEINGNLQVHIVVVPTGKTWTYIQCNKGYKMKCCTATTESYISIVEKGQNFLWSEKSLLAKADKSYKSCDCQDRSKKGGADTTVRYAHSADPAETEDGATGSHSANTILAISNMVLDSSGNGSGSSKTSTPISGSIRVRKRKQHPGQELQLESVGEVRTQQRYKATQEVFLDWVQEGSFDSDIEPAVPIVNWLYQIMATGNLQWPTVLTEKSAVLALFDNAKAIKQEHCFKEFMRAGSSSVVVDTKHDDCDISRVLDHFRNGPSNMELDMPDLARKLCWLLGVCGLHAPRRHFLHRCGALRDQARLARGRGRVP
ncbi:hypothetical protein EC968_008226 [Mortierella alpina]|nr:hypothetical protein EC968_008226 [Mortierella alpina]